MDSAKYAPIKLVEDTITRDDLQQLSNWMLQENTPKLTKGEQTVLFEEEFAAKIGTSYACFVNSGSSAILLALAALKADDRLSNNKVAVPGLSWVTDVSSVMQLGLQPILVDCNLRDLSINLDDLERVFELQRPSAVILVSVLGLVPNMKQFLELCQEYEVHVIEDVCESLGSEYRSHALGSLGHISCFSMYWGHHMSTIEGGMCCTDDFELAQCLYSLRSHGWSRDLEPERAESLQQAFKVDKFQELYTFYDQGFNLRSTDLQAFLGRLQLKRLPLSCEQRAENFSLYQNNLKSNRLRLRIHPKDFISNMAMPVLLHDRKECIEHLQDNEIEVRPLIAGSMGRQPFYMEQYGVKELKNCDRLHTNGFYVPNHHKLSHVDIERVCDIINLYE